jgi:hypothetical protein
MGNTTSKKTLYNNELSTKEKIALMKGRLSEYYKINNIKLINKDISSIYNALNYGDYKNEVIINNEALNYIYKIINLLKDLISMTNGEGDKIDDKLFKKMIIWYNKSYTFDINSTRCGEYDRLSGERYFLYHNTNAESELIIEDIKRYLCEDKENCTFDMIAVMIYLAGEGIYFTKKIKNLKELFEFDKVNNAGKCIKEILQNEEEQKAEREKLDKMKHDIITNELGTIEPPKYEEINLPPPRYEEASAPPSDDETN